VRRYLAHNTAASLQQLMGETGLTKLQIQRTQAWKEYEEHQLDDYLKDNPQAQVRNVKAVFCFSAGKTAGMRAWRDHMVRRKQVSPPRQVQERSLLRSTLECRPDEASAGPCQRLEHCDEILRTLMEDAGADTAWHLNRLNEMESQQLVDYIVAVMDDGTLDSRDQQTTRALQLEIARSWLEQHEQEQRHQDRRRR
jgi:hypothetical protein